MAIKINLHFNDGILMLVGFQYGVETYEKQIKPNIDINNKIRYTVVFPDKVQLISSSFSDGLINEIISIKMQDRIEFVSRKNKNINKEIYSDCISNNKYGSRSKL